MRPLTEKTPKPLLQVANKPLIEHHLVRLAAAGFNDIIINVAYLGEQIIQALGNGERWGCRIHYSREHSPLETAGGILHAGTLLGEDPFVLINGDVWTDYPLKTLRKKILANDTRGHLVLTNNPEHNPEGDFSIADNHRLIHKQIPNYTYSGISLIDPQLIQHYPRKQESFPLGEVFRDAIDKQLLSAELYEGEWVDVGTVERLNQLNNKLK